MDFLQISKIVFLVLGIFLAIWFVEYILVLVVGAFSKKKVFPEQKEKLKYGVVICARNEEKVVAQLIESIRKTNYPQDKIEVFVIAHNCTDNTAQVARTQDAVVYEYSNPNERTKGYALKKIFEFIQRDYGIQNFDGFHVFDADNILDEQYMTKMNDAFLYYDKKRAITSFRNAKNFGENVQTACYGMMYTLACRVETRGRMSLNCAARILGSGFLVSADMVKDGWNIVIPSDDTDFTIDQVLQGQNVMYCDEAMYYDEHPTTFKAMWRQRLRWARGTLVVLKKRCSSLFKQLFGRRKNKQEKPLRFSSFDLLSAILPIGALGFFCLLLDLTCKTIFTILGYPVQIVWGWWLYSFLLGAVLFYIGFMVAGIVAYALERKRIKNISRKTKILSLFVWPLFLIMLTPLQIVALFQKKFVWTEIKHTNQANFNTFHMAEKSNLQVQSSDKKEEIMKNQKVMDIVIISGGSGNDALVKGLKTMAGGGLAGVNVNVIVNAYDNGKSTGVCRAVTNTLGVSDIRKNHSRMYEAVHGDKVDKNLMEFYDKRFDFEKGKEVEQISALLNTWGLQEYIDYVKAFFARDTAQKFEYKDFSVANIVYAEMFAQIGYEKTNQHFCNKMGINDFVVLNSFDNVFIKAKTQSGHIIQDEGETVFWNNPDDKIIQTIFDVENGSYGLNQRAINLVKNADLILISTGTFWSSIQPTIEYLDFYKHINASKAKKIWMMNNNEDGDAFGVGSLDFVKFMEKSGLNLADFEILLNNDAVDLLKQTDKSHTWVFKSMENNKGKHNPTKFAKAVLEMYYGIDQSFEHIIFDFDDTIWSRNSQDEICSKENIQELNNSFNNKAIIISGNSYSSIYEKLQTIYGKNLKDFALPVWADANSTLYQNNKKIKTISQMALSPETVDFVLQKAKSLGLQQKTILVGDDNVINIKFKPLTEAQRDCVMDAFMDKNGHAFSAWKTGKTTVDVLSQNNNKAAVLPHLNLDCKQTLFIGDEIKRGNDFDIAQKCKKAIEVKSVYEANLILKLLK